MIELENVFKPKKRVFVSLTLASAVIGAMVIYMAWRVALPGLEQINAKLPVVFGGIGIAIALALLAGVAGIVLAILGVPIMKIFYFWAWKAVNILFPFAVVLGRIFDIPRSKIEQSFIEVSNHLPADGAAFCGGGQAASRQSSCRPHYDPDPALYPAGYLRT